MRAALQASARADKVLETLSPRDLKRVIEVLTLLSEFPLMAQTANISKAPDVRRAVAGAYLMYYRYDPVEQIIRIEAVRHGRQKPITAKELEE